MKLYQHEKTVDEALKFNKDVHTREEAVAKMLVEIDEQMEFLHEERLLLTSGKKITKDEITYDLVSDKVSVNLDEVEAVAKFDLTATIYKFDGEWYKITGRGQEDKVKWTLRKMNKNELEVPGTGAKTST